MAWWPELSSGWRPDSGDDELRCGSNHMRPAEDRSEHEATEQD